ncbi:flagellin FliC [Leclercia adecarboxylata]|uniref:flagellin N-terminal helical domain-containing protein n=1 Tax=Leclercia adecarboxylata TaxID=83655 RepID=UPI00185FA5E2|nr:flagellin [Leclercia adecarboxylata]QNP35231.1 flagellin FliC [Leclercia adecarboxylata]
MAVINTNSLSLMTQNNLNKSQSSLGTAIERLSSGLRINSAKDDAAGQAIANRFTSNINGLNVAARNANDGISLAQTAEGALSEINNNLQRIRDLTVQAQNSSNSASDIDSIQSEVNERMKEIDRVTTQTDFNGKKILNNATDTAKAYDFQVGSKDDETIGISINSASGWNLASANADKTTSAVTAGVYVNTADAATTLAKVDNTARKVDAIGFDVMSGKVTGDAVGGGSPLQDIDDAIKAVDTQRSSLGASQNRFESTITNPSVLAQANQVPQTMLSLLR